MERRSFILLTTATVITFYLPLTSCKKQSKLENILADPYSLLLIMNSNSINEIGMEYINQLPNEGEKEILVNFLLHNEIHNKESQSFSIIRIQNMLKLKIKNDYKNNSTITLGGWVISKTEARQCALSSIINS